MSLAETVYTARFRSTETIERGRTQVLTCPTSRAGATATPTAGTFSLYRPDGSALVSAQAVTIPPASVAQYTLSGATTSAEITNCYATIKRFYEAGVCVNHTFDTCCLLCNERLAKSF